MILVLDQGKNCRRDTKNSKSKVFRANHQSPARWGRGSCSLPEARVPLGASMAAVEEEVAADVVEEVAAPVDIAQASTHLS